MVTQIVYAFQSIDSGAGSSPQLGGGHNNFSGHIYIEKDLISMNDSKNWGGHVPPCPPGSVTYDREESSEGKDNRMQWVNCLQNNSFKNLMQKPIVLCKL